MASLVGVANTRAAQQPPICGGPKCRNSASRMVAGSYVIGRHFPICENREEVIEDVVGECPAIARIGPRAPVVGRSA